MVPLPRATCYRASPCIGTSEPMTEQSSSCGGRTQGDTVKTVVMTPAGALA
jgi:hypothetical protein